MGKEQGAQGMGISGCSLCFWGMCRLIRTEKCTGIAGFAFAERVWPLYCKGAGKASKGGFWAKMGPGSVPGRGIGLVGHVQAYSD